MRSPDFLPDGLTVYEACSSEKELFQALQKKPDDLVLFFECACADTQWAMDHPHWIRMIVRWSAKSYYLNALTLYDARRIARIMQVYYRVLEPYLIFRPALFSTIAFQVDGEEIWVNSFLFGIASPFLKEICTNAFEQWLDYATIPQVSLSFFRLIQEYIYHPDLVDLWKLDQQMLLSLMNQAKMWNLPELVMKCAAILKRYIDADHVIDMLMKAHACFFFEWKLECIYFFNKQEWGIRLAAQQASELSVFFLNFNQNTLDIFEKLASYVTHLGCSGTLCLEPIYQKLVASCPKLIGVDLSGAVRFEAWELLPSRLEELNVSGTSWLGARDLRKIAAAFPSLKKIELSGNTQLNHLAWAELTHFNHLISLTLSQCQQIKDEDLKLILHPLSHLTELDLEECRQLTDQGVTEILLLSPRLTSLKLGRCHHLTDKALYELGIRGYQLTHLSIRYCAGMREAGVLRFLHLRPNLIELDLTGVNFSAEVVARIRRHFPFLNLTH